MALLKFLKGNYSSLNNAAIAEGQVLICGDTGEMFVDVAADKRVKIGDFITIANIAALEALDATAVPTSRLYYVEDGNILARSNGTKWVQVNKQPTADEMKTLLGLGTAAYTDADAYDVAGAAAEVRAYVGDIPNGEDGSPMAESVIAYINKKTDGIATSGNLEALGNRVTTAEGEIDALQEASAKHVEKEEGKSLIADTEIARLAAMSDGANKVEESETNGNIKIDGKDVVVYTHPATHTVSEISDFDEKVKAYDYATKSEAQGYANAKDDAIASAQKAGDDAQNAIDDYKTANDAALALKADKSVVEAMYTNEQIDTAVQGAKDYAKDLVDALPEQTDYTVTITENTDDATVAKTYVFTQNGAEIGTIKLAKELVVTSGSVKEVETADAPYAGAKVGDKYIELVIANQDAPIYVPAKDLVDIYTAKGGAAEVQVAISNTNEISATLVNGGIAEEKLADGVKTKLNKVWEEVGVAKGLVDALADGQVKTNKEAIEQAQKDIDVLEALPAAGITAQNITDWNDAVVKEHEHANKDVLDGITDEKVAAWDAAQANVIETVKVNGEAVAVADKAVDITVPTGALADKDEVAETDLAEALATKINGKANAADVYAKTETYSKTEVEALLTWGEF